MSTDPFQKKTYLGESVIICRGYQLCALLSVCERAARSLDDVGDGKYRERVMSSLANTLELAEEVAGELLIALERLEPKSVPGGERNG